MAEMEGLGSQGVIVASKGSAVSTSLPILYSTHCMRLLLLLLLLVATSPQFLRDNTWQLQPTSLRPKGHRLFSLLQGRGTLQILQEGNRLAVLLLGGGSSEWSYLLGVGPALTLVVEFGEVSPSRYGKVEVRAALELTGLSLDGSVREATLRVGAAKGRYHLVFRPNRQLEIRSASRSLLMQTQEYSLPRVLLLGCCSAMLRILLLRVLASRKKWYEMSGAFLMVGAGWQARAGVVLWWETALLRQQGSGSLWVLVVALLLLLSLLGLRLALESYKIVSSIDGCSWKSCMRWVMVTASLLFLPLWLLHYLLPLHFLLQFTKYSKFSRLDSEVHYACLLLQLLPQLELAYRIFHFRSTPFQTNCVLILLYTSVCAVLSFVIGELYQYSPQANRTSPCVGVDFNNRKYCPGCGERLFTKSHEVSEDRERKDLDYGVWQFGVAECGHILHCDCLVAVLRAGKGCPLSASPPKMAEEKEWVLSELSSVLKVD